MSNTRPVFVFHLIEVLVKQIKLVVIIYLQLLLNPSFILLRVLLAKNNHCSIHILVKVGFVRDSICNSSCHDSGRHQMINCLVVLGRLRNNSVISECEVVTLILVIAFAFAQPDPVTLCHLACHHFSHEHTLKLFDFVFCIFGYDSFWSWF
jgi:hypothetical protein